MPRRRNVRTSTCADWRAWACDPCCDRCRGCCRGWRRSAPVSLGPGPPDPRAGGVGMENGVWNGGRASFGEAAVAASARPPFRAPLSRGVHILLDLCAKEDVGAQRRNQTGRPFPRAGLLFADVLPVSCFVVRTKHVRAKLRSPRCGSGGNVRELDAASCVQSASGVAKRSNAASVREPGTPSIFSLAPHLELPRQCLHRAGTDLAVDRTVVVVRSDIGPVPSQCRASAGPWSAGPRPEWPVPPLRGAASPAARRTRPAGAGRQGRAGRVGPAGSGRQGQAGKVSIRSRTRVTRFSSPVSSRFSSVARVSIKKSWDLASSS